MWNEIERLEKRERFISSRSFTNETFEWRDKKHKDLKKREREMYI